ncbi:Trk system potassium transporter TrkA [Fulvivirga sediminis]|uniref:Trk system potassium uptake protein TrkA n=1 Tax=Fulvivirga sediminis TaxID=2803949 RepID=A0A937F616_9BACT|nr:Trk system potassium transporter TrkA [Fulvivirga sediminis]MBL3654960.1 Trk system potassium transporter TrkA [Fulvivirga sediminis]
MRIIIAGAGDVGFHLAKLLAYEEQDIILIDMDGDRLRQAASNLDVSTIKGSSTSYSVLEEADVANADLLIAVTSSEETNITTTIIGKHLGAKKTIARIQNVEYLLNKEKLNLADLGIDEIISPESLAAKEIKRLLKEIALTDTFDFDEGRLSLVGVTVDENSKLKDKTLIEAAHLNPNQNFVTVAILRDSQTIIPHGDNKFIEGDHAYFIAQPNGIDTVLELSGKRKQEIKNIMILGGSKVGFHAAKRLSRKFNVKLIERDREKCHELADQLKDVMVICGDGRDVDLLQEEAIEEMDAFIAVTGNSETNIISCLVAKNNNVKKTISLVENIDYIHLSQNIGVDTMINKKLIAANFIFRYIRKGDVISLTSIHGVDAEILEFIVKAGSKITTREIKELDFPKGAIIGGVVRNGVGYTTMGDFQFRPKDRAVVLCRPECIHDVEEFFK